jgi:hypothetical protein
MKGISFKPEMYRAIMAGNKTQTRRQIKPQPVLANDRWDWHKDGRSAVWRNGLNPSHTGAAGFVDFCPYGTPGTVLFIKEAIYKGKGCFTYYGIDDKPVTFNGRRMRWRWKPERLAAMYMPRKAAREFIAIKNVRAERLHDMSDADAIAEGIERVPQCGILRCAGWKDYTLPRNGFIHPVESYRSLWESINGKGSWAENPWAWVVEFFLVGPL